MKLKGGSTVEVIVAMVLIGITFVMALRIYMNISAGSATRTKIELAATAREALSNCISNPSGCNQFIETDFGVVKCSTSKSGKLIELSVLGTDRNNRVVCELKRLVYEP